MEGHFLGMCLLLLLNTTECLYRPHKIVRQEMVLVVMFFQIETADMKLCFDVLLPPPFPALC